MICPECEKIINRGGVDGIGPDWEYDAERGEWYCSHKLEDFMSRELCCAECFTYETYRQALADGWQYHPEWTGWLCGFCELDPNRPLPIRPTVGTSNTPLLSNYLESKLDQVISDPAKACYMWIVVGAVAERAVLVHMIMEAMERQIGGDKSEDWAEVQRGMELALHQAGTRALGYTNALNDLGVTKEDVEQLIEILL